MKLAFRLLPPFGYSSAIAAAGAATLTGFLVLCVQPARADAMCGPEDSKYVEKIAAGLQPLAPKVTKTGAFVVKSEYPGDTTHTKLRSIS